MSVGKKKKNKPKAAQRDDRKMKHEEKMQKRSRLRPIENEMRLIEKTLVDLEEKQKQENLYLITITQTGNSEKIQQLMKEIGAREKELEQLYAKYMDLDQQLRNT